MRSLWRHPSDGPNPHRGAGPYHILKTVKAGGTGGFDYVYADVEGRRLYIPRRGDDARITVFDLDTLNPVGTIPNVNGHGAVVDPKTNHAFTSSKPVVMWDTKTLVPIKAIDVQGNPDGIFFDAFNQRVYVFSHIAPDLTVIDAKYQPLPMTEGVCAESGNKLNYDVAPIPQADGPDF